jgi:hypothetical protein
MTPWQPVKESEPHWMKVTNCERSDSRWITVKESGQSEGGWRNCRVWLRSNNQLWVASWVASWVVCGQIVDKSWFTSSRKWKNLKVKESGRTWTKWRQVNKVKELESESKWKQVKASERSWQRCRVHSALSSLLFWLGLCDCNFAATLLQHGSVNCSSAG